MLLSRGPRKVRAEGSGSQHKRSAVQSHRPPVEVVHRAVVVDEVGGSEKGLREEGLELEDLSRRDMHHRVLEHKPLESFGAWRGGKRPLVVPHLDTCAIDNCTVISERLSRIAATVHVLACRGGRAASCRPPTPFVAPESDYTESTTGGIAAFHAALIVAFNSPVVSAAAGISRVGLNPETATPSPAVSAGKRANEVSKAVSDPSFWRRR